MSYYINPKNQSKEDWLKANAVKEHTSTPRWGTAPQATMFVCLVDNGPFTAAAIVVNRQEYDAFNAPTDTRPKVWYTVPVAKLSEVCPHLK